ncbi:hypothetical protein HGA91_00495 [candidate division WWE3 bacterium]|nr:hypothetical protein [candidate division WWE3 bacterium]
MANKNGFSAIEILAIILIISLVAGGIYVLNSSRDTVIPIPTQSVTTTTPSATVAPTDEYSNWETYTNPTFGFSFKYPKDEIFMFEQSSSIGGKDYNIALMSKELDNKIKNGVDLASAAIANIGIYTSFERNDMALKNWKTPNDFFVALTSLQLNIPTTIKSDLELEPIQYTKLSEDTLNSRKILTFSASVIPGTPSGAYSNYFVYTLNGDNLIVLSDQPNTDPEHNLSLFKQIAATFTFVE